MIVDTIEESVECEPVTVKLKKPKVRRTPLSLILKHIHARLLTTIRVNEVVSAFCRNIYVPYSICIHIIL